MQQIQQGYRSVSLLIGINADRIIFLAALAAALLAGAFLAGI